MINELLTPDVIQIIPACEDWRQAISLACQPLQDNRTIEGRYVEAIFRSHEEIGPYYVVGPGIAMPHARPEEGANKTGISLTIIQQGVNFGSAGNDPVHLVIVLAASDSNSHIGIISSLAALFDNPDDTASLIAAKNVADIHAILSRY
ncbi:PTS sugar transporter subunit IIA [Erwinia sp. 9145]|uniref:PTS sugar transporter subunit IIA n=1 Tax=Erwinia sp. 9145 TaxID=1500895 RepID=UPI00054F0853|nr:PTS sugar transporter subunit IIA [Erwinia sp. 9145]